MRPNRFALAIFISASLSAPLALASTDEVAANEAEAAVPVVESADAAEADVDQLSGEAVYDAVLDNRFDSFDQSLEMISGDRGGNIETVEMDVKYKSFREDKKKFFSKTIALYQAPPDVRYMGYLIINKRKGADDQFVYRPSARRVRRVNLRGESVVGTDFSLEDIIPRELEDASYDRLPDESLNGREVYVVEVRPMEDANSEYSKFVTYVDKTSFVTLRNRYWDSHGVLFKELTSDVDSITRYDGDEKAGAKTVWVATESKIVNLQLESYTTLTIKRLVANPKLGNRDFTERKLAQGH